ncbi:MAG TPA: MarR family winged helix-turn-helix transcriptional regulator [Acetobacteraceae bacterium]|jgi:DNA-binding MarR family transcriptional regulator|nr:MarR family winged helix-turn-helix transcriptional regulator [Acetobacteraceae bacterium]
MSAALDEPSPQPSDYRLDRSVGHLLRRAHQRHVALFQVQAAETGLTPPQLAALAGLHLLGRTTQNALGRAVAMDSATIQGVVQRLLARGLVTAARDPMDRRTLVLALTEPGHAALAHGAACAVRARDELLGCLSAEERETFLALLRKAAGVEATS